MPSRAAEPGPGRAPRRPEQLLLAFTGELVLDRGLGPVPTALLVDLLEGLGVGEAATRATLARMARRGLLAPVRDGRSVGYLLTPDYERVLREAHGRVFAEDPFAPEGGGWTLVTFSVPERRRELRHRVRAELTWAGFGLLRDGLWIAPGEVAVPAPLVALVGDGLDLVAFRASEVEGFSAARSVAAAWRLDEIRARHEEFRAEWAAPAAGDPVAGLTALVADWLALLRAVPRLPAEHLDDDWPAAACVRAFRERHAELAAPARAELARRLAG
jgi:phenylacetic acid degradation operon negative regulatory protein